MNFLDDLRYVPPSLAVKFDLLEGKVFCANASGYLQVTLCLRASNASVLRQLH